MSQIPTPPVSRHASEVPDVLQEKSPVVDSLDTLLERYLGLLDRHQKLQAELAKRLSSGFLSLAHANYTCPPGRWYGTDYYDERMKATRKISLRHSLSSDSTASESASLDHYRHAFTIESTPDQRHQADENGQAEQSQSATDSPEDESLTEDKDNNSAKAVDSSNPSGHSEENTKEPHRSTIPKKKKFRSLDPITWYGILVPPSLRRAQKSFTEGIEGPVPELASVVVEMRAVEREVERVRRTLEK